MNRTHLDIMDYLLPTLVLGFLFCCLLMISTGLGTILVPDTNCGEDLYFYGTQMTVYGTSEEAETYPLPFGYWIEDNTQRVLKLRAWDGSWARWSYGGVELSSGSGWLLTAGTILSGIICMAVGLLAGFLVSLLIPKRLIESLYVKM